MRYFLSIWFAPWSILLGTLAGFSPRDTLRSVVNNPFSQHWLVLGVCTFLGVLGMVRVCDPLKVPPELLNQGLMGALLFYGGVAVLGSLGTVLFYFLVSWILGRLSLPKSLPSPMEGRKLFLALLGGFIFFAWMNFPGIGAFAFVFGWLFRYLALRTRLDLSRENAFFVMAISLILEATIPALLLWSFRIVTLFTT